MSDEAALLAAIRDNPDEDTPRLIYADWLDEQGGEANAARAEFIRVQCEFSLIPEVVNYQQRERWNQLYNRERLLLDAHRVTWLKSNTAESSLPGNLTFRRGFVSEADLYFEDLRSSTAAILAHPVLRTLSVSGIDDLTFPDFLKLDWLGAVRGLSLQPGSRDWPEGRPIPPDWSRLADSKCFAALESLYLWGRGILTHEGAARLAANATFAEITNFQMLMPPRSQSLPTLLGEQAFRSLKTLCLQGHEYPTPFVPDIFHNPRLARLEKLNLREFQIERSTIESMTTAPFWGTLRELTLGDSGIDASVLKALGSATSGSIETLCLCQPLFSDLSGLCGPVLRSVRALHLLTGGGMDLDTTIVGRLAECEYAVELRSLSLSNHLIGDAEAAIIARSPRFSQLYTLDLSRSGITPVGAMTLANSPYLNDIASLCLFACRLDDRSKAALRERFGDHVWLDCE